MTRAPAPAAESPRHRVVTVGAGFGGLFAARALRPPNWAIALLRRGRPQWTITE